jgi:class 3 adenylate cyclase
MASILEPGSRKRKLAAILHADVVGYSRLMGEDEAGTHQALGELRQAVDPLIAAHEGRIVGTAGDSVLADFSSVVDALNCAVEMQRAARAINEPVPQQRRLELRIGVNLGDVIVDGDNIFGDGVNIAARLEGLARPGTICISHTVYDQVRNKLDLDYRPLGSHRVKNIAQPARAYAVGVPAAAPRPSRRRRDFFSRRPRSPRSASSALSRGRFTRVEAASCSVSALRPSRSKSRALPLPPSLQIAPQWQCSRLRIYRTIPTRNISAMGSQRTSLQRSVASRTCSS